MRRKIIQTAFLFFGFLLFLPPFFDVNAQSGCEIKAPGSVTYGSKIEITVNAPGKKYLGFLPQVDYNETEFTIRGTTTNFLKTYEAKNATGKDVQIDVTADLIPKVDENGNPTSEQYSISAVTWNTAGRDTAYPCSTSITVQPNESADSPDFTPNPTRNPVNPGGRGVTIDPVPAGDINGNTVGVTITFEGLPDDTYKACLLTDQGRCTKGGDFREDDLPEQEGDTMKFVNVCGNGSEALKIEEDGCDPDRDYFHEGNNYKLGLYNADFHSGPIAIAQFYVKYAYPHVAITGVNGEKKFNAYFVTEQDNSTQPDLEVGNPIEVSISQLIKPGGEKRNNYQLVLESTDKMYKKEKCVTVGDDGGINEASYTFTYEDLYGGGGASAQIPARSYVLKVNEQINEGGNNIPEFDDDCQGGFTYYHIPIDVVVEGNTLKTYVIQSRVERDPNGVERENLREIFDLPPLPCARGLDVNGEETTDKDRIAQCLAVETALGPFALEPGEFISDIFGWVIAFAGLGALALLVYAGYQIIYSRGDQERIQNAKDTIKAVVIGLTFILLSIAILEFIGVDVLKIPGFLG